MLTTFQAAQRLSQKIWGRDFSRLSMTEAEELRDGINLTLDEFASLLPHHRRSREETFVFDEPRVLTLTVTAGSAGCSVTTSFPLGFYPDAAALTGRGFVLGSMPYRFLSGTVLHAPWIGSSGSVTVSLHADAVPMPATTVQVAGAVRWQRQGQTQPVDLTHHADAAASHAVRSQPMLTGDPVLWWMEPFGGAQAVQKSLLLRVWPAPAAPGILQVPLKGFMAAVSMADLNITPREIPVGEDETGHFMALAAEKLVTASGRLESLDIGSLRELAAGARRQMESRACENPAAQPNEVGTPEHW